MDVNERIRQCCRSCSLQQIGQADQEGHSNTQSKMQRMPQAGAPFEHLILAGTRTGNEQAEQDSQINTSRLPAPVIMPKRKCCLPVPAHHRNAESMHRTNTDSGSNGTPALQTHLQARSAGCALPCKPAPGAGCFVLRPWVDCGQGVPEAGGQAPSLRYSWTEAVKAGQGETRARHHNSAADQTLLSHPHAEHHTDRNI